MKDELTLLKQTEKSLTIELEILGDVKKKAVEDYGLMKGRLCSIRDKIKLLSPVELSVSDHALVRYMERISGVSLDELRCDVVSKIQPSFIVTGDGKFPIDSNFIAVVKDGKVVTIKGVK